MDSSFTQASVEHQRMLARVGIPRLFCFLTSYANGFIVLEAIHPVIRTNPVTGWKSVFAVGHHVQKINGLSDAESKDILEWFVRLIVDNHDLQVRHRWQNVNDLAIWDNRSVYHAATPDYIGLDLGERTGQRAVSLGERPYLDPESVGRREALNIPL
jgi:hypothetical protein